MSSLITLVMYHYIKDSKTTPFKNFKFLDKSEFETQVRELKKKYEMLSVEDLIDILQKRRTLDRPAALLTFDDGYSDHYEVALPILEKEGVKGAFFPPAACIEEGLFLDVNKIHLLLAKDGLSKMLLQEIEGLCKKTPGLKSFSEYWNELAVANQFDLPEIIFVKRMLQHALPETIRIPFLNSLFDQYVSRNSAEDLKSFYLNPKQIKEMVSLGHHIGSHGYAHKWLNHLPQEEQEFELRQSIEFLNRVGVKENYTVCYPYGGYNQETLKISQRLGFKAGYTIIPGMYDLRKHSHFEIPRIDTKELVI